MYVCINTEIYRYKELKRYFESDQRQNVPSLRSTVPSVSFIIYQPTQLGLIVNDEEAASIWNVLVASQLRRTNSSSYHVSRQKSRRSISFIFFLSLLDLPIKFFIHD